MAEDSMFDVREFAERIKIEDSEGNFIYLDAFGTSLGATIDGRYLVSLINDWTDCIATEEPSLFEGEEVSGYEMVPSGGD
jgi:hypothetical protein